MHLLKDHAGICGPQAGACEPGDIYDGLCAGADLTMLSPAEKEARYHMDAVSTFASAVCVGDRGQGVLMEMPRQLALRASLPEEFQRLPAGLLHVASAPMSQLR